VYEYNPWGVPTYTPPTYTIPTTTTSRWHCPDCKGWVVDWLPVHHCTTGYTTTTPYINTKSNNHTSVTFDDNNEVKFVKSVN